MGNGGTRLKKEETRKGWPDIFAKKHFTRSAFRNVVGAACEITILLPVSKLTLSLPFLFPLLLFFSFLSDVSQHFHFSYFFSSLSPRVSLFLVFFFFFFFFIFLLNGIFVKSLVSPRWFTETRRRIDLWFQRDSCARIIFESTVDRCEWKICARWKVCAFDGCSGKRSIWMFDENGGVEKGECLVTYVSPTCTARFLVIE